MNAGSRRLVGGAAVVLSSFALLAASAFGDDVDRTKLVNPLVGTQNDGTTYPGATTPFGMVQLSPDTEDRGIGAYNYDHPSLLGFSHTHLSGVGCPTQGNIRVTPTVGTVRSGTRLTFNHANETAEAGYYSLGLDNGVKAELTADTRTGFHRYTFPSSTQANVQFEAGRSNGDTYGAEVHVVGNDTIEGFVRAGNFCTTSTTDRYLVYFSAKFDRQFASFGTWNNNTVTAGGRDGSATNQRFLGAYARFDTTQNNQVGIAVGISYTGYEGARKNREAEANTTDATPRPRTFDEVRAATQKRWNDELGRIAIDGGSTDDQKVFYTSLYHAVLHPNIGSDVDGAYYGADTANHVANGWTYYQNYSLWDTYRSENQFLSLLHPNESRDMMRSIVQIQKDGGWLPRWSQAGQEGNVMGGDPVTSYLADAWSKGLLAGFENDAWTALWQNANGKPTASDIIPSGRRVRGRDGNDSYTSLGWIAYVNTRGYQYEDENNAGSATMEYALSDCALSAMAQSLGKGAEAALLRQRAQNYRNLWDPSMQSHGFSGFPRARNAGGAFVGTSDPAQSTGFQEGTPWQYQFLAPQDVEGEFALMGGPREAAKRLDDFFAMDQILADPYKAAHEDWVVGPYAYNNATHYNPNNEPDLQTPWMYAYTRQPWKTSAVTRAAQTLFVNAPNGVTGNDDLGAMSSWYAFSALGMYPVMSGSGEYVLNAPRFSRAVISLENGHKLTIEAPGASGDLQYIAGLTKNGAPVNTSYLDHDGLVSGDTTLHYTLTSTPPTNGWGTGPGSEPKSLCASTTSDFGDVDVDSPVGGSVPATLALSLGLPASFGAFTPGIAGDYSASTTANVVSTAGDAALSAADASGTAAGHLVNGTFSLPRALLIGATSPIGTATGPPAPLGASTSPTPLLSYAGPVSNDPVTVSFKQAIDANDPLRTGSYGKTVTFTLSTTAP